ncbi:hypothetical protein BDR26DRAFT_1003888 [Obelidium mucronatum]|nr:hypothetical protein BDR26DRAFT_1003888 [Obelidium mucronatum]
MDSLNRQIIALTTKTQILELDCSTKLARINTEHVKELEDLQSVHMIRLQILQEQRDQLQLQVYNLQDKVESLTVQLDSVSKTAGLASKLAGSLEELRRDSKCDIESMTSKAQMEREARVSEVLKREQVEREMNQRVANVEAENENLLRIIEGLRIENEHLRHLNQQRKTVKCNSISELLETDLTMMDVGI